MKDYQQRQSKDNKSKHPLQPHHQQAAHYQTQPHQQHHYHNYHNKAVSYSDIYHGNNNNRQHAPPWPLPMPIQPTAEASHNNNNNKSFLKPMVLNVANQTQPQPPVRKAYHTSTFDMLADNNNNYTNQANTSNNRSAEVIAMSLAMNKDMANLDSLDTFIQTTDCCSLASDETSYATAAAVAAAASSLDYQRDESNGSYYRDDDGDDDDDDDADEDDEENKMARRTPAGKQLSLSTSSPSPPPPPPPPNVWPAKKRNDAHTNNHNQNINNVANSTSPLNHAPIHLITEYKKSRIQLYYLDESIASAHAYLSSLVEKQRHFAERHRHQASNSLVSGDHVHVKKLNAAIYECKLKLNKLCYKHAELAERVESIRSQLNNNSGNSGGATHSKPARLPPLKLRKS